MQTTQTLPPEELQKFLETFLQENHRGPIAVTGDVAMVNAVRLTVTDSTTGASDTILFPLTDDYKQPLEWLLRAALAGHLNTSAAQTIPIIGPSPLAPIKQLSDARLKAHAQKYVEELRKYDEENPAENLKLHRQEMEKLKDIDISTENGKRQQTEARLESNLKRAQRNNYFNTKFRAEGIVIRKELARRTGSEVQNSTALDDGALHGTHPVRDVINELEVLILAMPFNETY